ncbi:hypothetical protein [Limosilactobacillus vaginalis]|uniref:hypothetical protein n=1 Tax=Limosilactobacillus vaginalis TaxID=1633 RepID=UPI0025A345D6|nr:hypothetical protein [Limosilactobacillus vaginalis]MDM8222541.1 hypothetical protein [Limosilactobacillus vaginalis]
MKFKRLKALYDADAGVHYEGKLCEIISINELKKTAQVAEAGQMFAIPDEVKASELE